MGLSQAQLGRLLKYAGPNTISRKERGEHSVQHVEAIAVMYLATLALCREEVKMEWP